MFNFKQSAVIVVLASLFLSTPEARSEVIKIRSDYWCPYVCNLQSENPGYLIEIIQRIFEKQNYSVEIRLTNRARALKEIRRKQINIMIGGHLNYQEFITSGRAVGQISNYFYTPANSKWHFRKSHSLRGKRIGIINGYSYGKNIDSLIKKYPESFVTISGARPLTQILKMIEARRLDAFIENPLVMRETLKELNIAAETYKIASSNLITEPMLYLSFANPHPKSELYAQVFGQGLLQLRRSGELQEILQKYSIKDWETSPLLATLKKSPPSMTSNRK